MYIYLSESETFTEFDNPSALFWLEEDLIYGDWTSGENGDGSYTKTATIPLSEVSHCLQFLIGHQTLMAKNTSTIKLLCLSEQDLNT